MTAPAARAWCTDPRCTSAHGRPWAVEDYGRDPNPEGFAQRAATMHSRDTGHHTAWAAGNARGEAA